MPIRVLFLNTRDHCGADVAVHLMMMKNFSPDEVEIFVISNSEAADAEDMRARLSGMAHVRSTFLPLGKPSGALAGTSSVGRALAYGPSLASLAKAAAFVRKNRIEVIHSTDRPRDATYACVLARMTGAASVVHMHAHAIDLSRPTIWGLRNATAVFAVSDHIRISLTVDFAVPEANIHTIYNAVDTDYFDPDDSSEPRPSIREQFGIPKTAPLVGIAARMNPWKGHIELIGAVSRLRAAFPDLHLIILAANVPEVRMDLEALARAGGIADRVHFAGFRNDVRPFLHEFDLFAHPSYGEPFGLSIAEAMAMRKPVIACGTGGVPEIITSGRDGWLVEERSPQDVAHAITVLLNDAEMRRQMGARARDTIRSRFTPRQQCAVAAQLYARLVTSAGSPSVVSSAS